MAEANSINSATSGIVINTGAAFTATTTTNHNLLIGAASNAITNVAPSATSGVPVISQGASADPTFGTAVVAGGGTGQTTLTNHGVLVGAGTSAITQLASGSAGQVLQSGGASADPSYSTATYPTTAGTSGNVLTSDGTNWTSSASGAGVLVQQVRTKTTTITSTTSTMNFNGTAPTTSQGAQVMSVAITPKNVNNILVIQVAGFTGTGTSAHATVVGLFQDSTTNALAWAGTTGSATGWIECNGLTYSMAAGTTSSTTFKIRFGPNNGVNSDFNGNGDGSNNGGTSYMSVTEYTS